MSAAPTLYGQRIALFFGGYFIFAGVLLPFFPVWLQSRSLNESEIALCLSLPLALRVFLTPFAASFADRAPNRRFAIRLFVGVALLAFLCAWPASGFWLLLLTTGTAVVFWHFSLPVAEALALTGVRRFGLDYGRMRFFGSVTFILTNLAGGAVLGAFAAGNIYWLLLAGLLVCFATAFILPVTPPAIRALDDGKRKARRPFREIVARPAILTLFLASGLVQAGHAMVYGFGSLYWQGLGFSGVEIGAFWATGVICEICLFIWSGAVVRRFGDLGLLGIGIGGALLRWCLFPFVGDAWSVVLVQSLHGLSFGASYLGLQHFIARVVPDDMTASAQGIYAMISGIIMAGMTAACGPLYATFGAEAFALMAVPAALAAILLVATQRLSRAERLQPQTSGEGG